jgi:hypothetical protein
MQKRGASDMLDPDTVIVKGGAYTLLALYVIRTVWKEFNDLRNDFRTKKRNR